MVFDASPLIYLAKLDSLDVIETAGYHAVLPPSVVREATEGGVSYRHPDAVLIAEAIRAGWIEVIEPTAEEKEEAARILMVANGIHAGESDVLAIALARRLPVSIFERRARRLARSLGLEVVDVVELLFAGMADPARLEQCIRSFASLVEMRLHDLDALMTRIERRQP